MAFVSEIEAVALECGFEPVGIIDEKHGVNETRRVSFAHQKSKISGDVVDGVFLTKFMQEYLCQASCKRGKEANMKELGCLGIDSSVQPVLLVGDPDHCFVERDLIRAGTAVGL